jgi:zinc/manganese transport system ATP-binding protein
MPPLLELDRVTLTRGERPIWQELSLEVEPGEFIAVLGPNGSGKTTLLKSILGLITLASGSVRVFGQPPDQARYRIGYIPQQKGFDPDLAIRGRDLVGFGLDGHRFGFSVTPNADERTDETIRLVEATAYADAPIGLLSGGQQQRLRIAQALVTQPKLLLADEPFLSLDTAAQTLVTSLLATRKTAGMSVLFVTHDLNASILPLVTRVLYLANGQFALGRPTDVLTPTVLSRLYGTPVDVARVGGRILVVPKADEPNRPARRKAHQ